MTTQFERTGNPFPGLRPFDTDEYDLFFGREGQSDELLARLARTRFLAVVGTSGSGKSSLIKTGLIPALYGGLMGGTGSAWRVAVMRPGHDPLGNLARALASDEVIGSTEIDDAVQAAIIETTLRRSTLGLVDAVRQARLAKYENVLVVVDQFEELFRFRAVRAREAATDDDAAAFVKLLLEPPRQRDVPLYVVLTMRSDFLGDCAQFWGLPEAINEGQYLIPRMTRDERRSAITGPVGIGGGEITLPLVNRLLNDVGDNPDQLPILQHALMRTWDFWAAHRRDGEALGLEHYEAIGTMNAALSLHADEAFNELADERSRHVAEVLFKALTERGADNREIRRPTRLSEICEIAGAREKEVERVVELFRREGRSFLMPPVGVELQPETVIDISHESLIRNWERLKKWVDEEAQSARIYRRVAESAVLHREGSEGLLQDPALQIALDWREKWQPNAAWGRRYHPSFDETMAYLEESRAAREARVAEERERERRELEQARAFADEQARANRKLRLLMVALAALLLVAFATAAFAWNARADALRSREEASMRAREAEVARERAEKLALDVQRSLEGEKMALVKAEDERRSALEATQKAVEARKEAEAESKRADAEADLAQKHEREAKAAETAARAAEAAAKAAEIAAEAEARKNKKAREANDLFRDAIARAQRGDFLNAKGQLQDAIAGYLDKDVANDEAMADASVQLGNVSYSVAYDEFLASGGDFNICCFVERVDESVKHYDEAAKIYAGPKVNSPEKAAVALYTLGNMLLKFTEKPAAGGHTDASGLLGASSLDVDVPDFDIRLKPPPMPGAWRSLDHDPAEDYKAAAVERYRQALNYYQLALQNFQKSGRLGGEDIFEGMKKDVFQAGSFYLHEAAVDRRDQAHSDEASGDIRQAVVHFEKLLSLYQPRDANDDVRVARLLVLIGALNLRVSEMEKAESYFQRALHAYQTRDGNTYDEARTLSDVAKISEEWGQTWPALMLYLRAVEKYKGDDKRPLETAVALYDTGRMFDAEGVSNKALENYTSALEYYSRASERDADAATPPGNLLRIGAFFKEYNRDDDALKAFRLAVALSAKFKRSDLELERARAFEEIGSLLDEENQEEALKAYQSALEIYTGLANEPVGYEGSKEAAASEVERVNKIIETLKKAIESKAKK